MYHAERHVESVGGLDRWGNTLGATTTSMSGICDFDGDGCADKNIPGSNPGLEWTVHGVSDVNRVGRSDILWRRTDGLGRPIPMSTSPEAT